VSGRSLDGFYSRNRLRLVTDQSVVTIIELTRASLISITRVRVIINRSGRPVPRALPVFNVEKNYGISADVSVVYTR